MVEQQQLVKQQCDYYSDTPISKVFENTEQTGGQTYSKCLDQDERAWPHIQQGNRNRVCLFSSTLQIKEGEMTVEEIEQ